jgi:hypothetical protein
MMKQTAREIARQYQMSGWRVEVKRQRDGRLAVFAVKRACPARQREVRA